MQQELAEGLVTLKNGKKMTRRELMQTRVWLESLLKDDPDAFRHLFEKCKSYLHIIPERHMRVLKEYRFFKEDGSVLERVTNVMISCLWNHSPGSPFELQRPYAD